MKLKTTLYPNIQFLRAISVLLVFFYHLKLDYFKIGYIGVDIFFLISGYVITSRLYNEYFETKKIDFLKFYSRRIKRIFPVLIFILTTVFFFIIFFQPLDLFIENLYVYFFTIFGASNIYYLFSKKDYFDNVFEDVFGHTWSLGVEEQFYLIFPFFLFFLLSFLKSKKVQSLFIILLIIIGILSTYIYSEEVKLIFYSPFFRFWQFLVGCLTYVIFHNYKKKNVYISTCSFVILFFIVISDYFENNLFTIISSTILTAIFILFYDKKNNLKFIFENKFFIFIGNISYSFYLWHLPIIYFYELYFLDNIFKVPLLFILTTVLSFLTYTFIEQKFRYLKFSSALLKRNIYIVISFIFVSIILIFYFSSQKSYENVVKNNFKNLIHNLNFLERKLNYSDRTVFYKININGNEIYRYCTESSKSFVLNNNNLRKQCLKSGANKKRLFYVIGNSHTANFIPTFNSIKLSDNDSFYFEHVSNTINQNNLEKINLLLNFYQEVYLVTNIEPYNIKVLENINEYLNGKIKILILSTIPNLNSDIDPLKCLIKKIDCMYSSSEDYEFRNLDKYFLEIKNFIKSQSFNRVLFYDAYKKICPDKNCYAYNVKKDLLTHRDNSHITIEASKLLIDDFSNFYNINLLKN